MKQYSWIGDGCQPQWKRVGSIDVADPADVSQALDRGYRIGTIYDGMSYSVAEPCAADTYQEIDDLPRCDCGHLFEICSHPKLLVKAKPTSQVGPQACPPCADELGQ